MENVEQETTRKLASIQTILKLEPITKADAIEKATILGWEVVVKKGDFKVGDSAVYFEIDSLLPRKEWNEFLFHNDKPEVRLKTVKLRGQVSQGLAMPLSILPITYEQFCGNMEVIETSEGQSNIPVKEGLDLTELLGVKKYVPYIPAQLMGQVKGTRPEFVPKTDEPRIQGEPQLLERYKGKTFYITEKIDGSSMSVYFNNGEFGVCSRNMDLKETEGNSFWKIARELDLENRLQHNETNLVLQGELWGQGVQGNKLKSDKLNFSVFNVYDINERRYLDVNEMMEVCDKLDIDSVPILDLAFELDHTVNELVEYASDKSFINREVYLEGLVFRPLIEERDSDIGRLSFKVINPKFLLHYKE